MKLICSRYLIGVAAVLSLLAGPRVAQAYSPFSSSGTGNPYGTPHAVNSTYQIDDGTSENSIGLTGGGDLICLNEFTVTGGNNIINSISIAWGTPLFPDPSLNGVAYTAVLWSDPSGIGNPSTAVVLGTVGGVIANNSTNTFITSTFAAPITVLTANFYVGFIITHPALTFPAAFDQDFLNLPLRSFVAGGPAGTGNINNLNMNAIPVAAIEGFGLIGNWMIRADAVPEPSTWAMMGVGAVMLVGLLRFRRRTS